MNDRHRPRRRRPVGARNVALDAEGILYISEFGGHRVRRLRADGIVESVVGIGAPGFAGDRGAATSAQLATPAGLASIAQATSTSPTAATTECEK